MSARPKVGGILWQVMGCLCLDFNVWSEVNGTYVNGKLQILKVYWHFAIMAILPTARGMRINPMPKFLDT